ncbi:MAG: transglutaminase domain-containing protein [Peptostreptococcaceae bacterium]|nr:transglutaminase domain-containing protein [Peptostreptococcaceae bacterium]
MRMMKKIGTVLLTAMILCVSVLSHPRVENFSESGSVPAQSKRLSMKKSAAKTKYYIATEHEFEKTLLKKIIAQESKIVIPVNYKKIGEKGVDRVLDRILENPDVLSIFDDWDLKFTNGRNGKFDFVAKMKYSKGAKELNHYIKKWVKANIDPSMSDEQKVRAIHDHMVLSYGYSKSFESSQNGGYSVYSPASLIYMKNGVCQAYSLYFYKMAKESGLDARYVSGDVHDSTEGHAWNYVKVDGSWYAMDITWDDPVPNEEGRLLHDYYLKSDLFMSESRKWNRSKYPKAPNDHPGVSLAKNEITHNIADVGSGVDDYDTDRSEIAEPSLQPKSDEPNDYAYIEGAPKADPPIGAPEEYPPNPWGQG